MTLYRNLIAELRIILYKIANISYIHIFIYTLFI